MERLVSRRSSGLSASGLRKWGLAFLVMGIFSQAILQNKMLGMAEGSNAQLLDLFTRNPDAMGIAAAAIVLQALESCAAPIFSFLLVEGFLHEEKFQPYLLKVLSVALVSELPYNLAVGGKLLDLSTRNPVFGLVFALVMLHFYRLYSEKGTRNTLLKLVASVAAFIWCAMLNVQHGQCIVILAGVLWMCRSKPNLRIMFGCTAAVVCCLFSPFYLLAPMSMMAIHFYNGEPGEENELMRFWMYPGILAIIAIVGTFLF